MPAEPSFTPAQNSVITELAVKAMFGSLIQRAAYLLAGQDEGLTWRIVSAAIVQGSVALARNTKIPVNEFVDLVRAEYQRQEALPTPIRVVPPR